MMKKTPTQNYLEQLSAALARGPEFGLSRAPLITVAPVSDETIEAAFRLLDKHSPLIMTGMSEDVSDQCVTLSARAFTSLNASGVPADIVIGTTYWNGQNVFPCDVESLKREALDPGDEGTRIKMHAWISLGGDTIIDMTLPQFLVLNRGAPEHFYGSIIASRVENIKDDGILYEPIIVGAEYIGKTNPPDPILALNHIQAHMARHAG